ncbi:hypothetical protein Tco_1145178 [Tanacetum coccineum]
MNDDLEYVKSLEKEVDELESEKADFSNIYDLLLEECVSKDSKECECLAQNLRNKLNLLTKKFINLLKSFSKLEKHSISLELALQQCKEQMKNNSVCKENGSNVFRKEREQYHEIQDFKLMQDKNIAISELKKLIENCKGKSVETQFNKPSVVRQPNAQRIPKPSVLGKPTPFSNSPEMRSFQTKQSVNKTNVSDGLFKQVTQQNLPQIRKQAVRNTNVIAPGPSRNCPKHVSHQSPREKVGSKHMVVPTGRKLLQLCTGKVENETTMVQNVDIPQFMHANTNLGLSADDVDHYSSDLLLRTKWCSVKITLQAPFLNVQKTFDRSRSSLGLHGDDVVHISSGLVLHQMTSDHNRSELRIQDHSNEQSSLKLVLKCCSYSRKDRFVTTRVKISLQSFT